MPSLTVENYLKAALQISLRSPHEWVSTGELAAALGVLPGTVTSMLKSLAEPKAEAEGTRPALVHYKPYEGIRLTDDGRAVAVRMLRRHRLIELFLVRTLNLTWDQVHEEAEHMEHAVSDFLIERIDEFLGRPQRDPHGDPIPSAEGDMPQALSELAPLTACEAGARVTLVRVTNQDPEFLRFLSERGLEIGSAVCVEENNAAAGVMTLSFSGKSVSVAHAAAETLLVAAT